MNGCKENYDKGKNHIRKGSYEIYVLYNQLYTGLGDALVDTGSQVSLVKESGLMRRSSIQRGISHIQGITTDSMQLKGPTELSIGDTSLHDFLVMDKLTMNYDFLLGQDWMKNLDVIFKYLL
jgi:hypothetical protein